VTAMTTPQPTPVHSGDAGAWPELVRLAGVVERLSAQVAARLAFPTPITAAGAAGEVVQVSWLMAPADPDAARTVLGGLVSWLGQVFLRYADAARGLPECWLWHPDVVEELLWCQHTWFDAYGPHGSPARVGEWHAAHRPGVLARIKTYAGMCSIETHQPRHTSPSAPAGTATAEQVPGVAVPFAGSVVEISQWWGSRRDQPAPHAPMPLSGQERSPR